MANTIITPEMIANEAIMQVENNCVFANNVHRKYKNEFVKNIGDSVTIKKPVKFEVNDGADITGKIQDATQTSTSIKIDQRKNVAWQFSSQELTMDIDDYSKEYIQPACLALANKIDASVASLYKDVPYFAGTAGTTPSTFANLGAAANVLDKNAVEQQHRRMIFDSDARWATADSFKNFYDAGTAGRARKGLIADMAGFGKIMMDQNIQYHTAGNTAGTTVVDGAGQSGATLHIDGLTTAAAELKKGDAFTIANVYHVNPISGETTGDLQQFTLTADATAASNEVDLAITPSIVTSGAYKTVNAAPADGAAVTFLGSHKANLAFHKNAFALVTVPLVMPDAATFKARATHNGLSIRVIKGFDIKTDVEVIRLDVFYGVKTLYEDLACRLLG